MAVEQLKLRIAGMIEARLVPVFRSVATGARTDNVHETDKDRPGDGAEGDAQKDKAADATGPALFLQRQQVFLVPRQQAHEENARKLQGRRQVRQVGQAEHVAGGQRRFGRVPDAQQLRGNGRAQIRAALLVVVNMAYDAPSLPTRHRCTIIMVVGKNCMPSRKSKTSSPKANKKGDSPKVMP